MSTLGSQARAAEYAAATAARARQVSREAEEQKLPPKSTPISLGAFTKTQVANRNKGQKAFRPLNFDEINENSDDGSTSKGSVGGTPTRSITSYIYEPTCNPASRRISGTTGSSDGIKMTVPTAPRAMMAPKAPATVIANPTPGRKSSQTHLVSATQQAQQIIHGTPSPFHHGWFPSSAPSVPPLPIQGYSPYLHLPVNTQSDELAKSQRFGSMMVPEDISPTKQEEELAMLSRGQQRLETPTHQPSHAIPAPFAVAHFPPVPISSQVGQYLWDLSSHDGPFAGFQLSDQSYPEEFDLNYAGCTYEPTEYYPLMSDEQQEPSKSSSSECATDSQGLASYNTQPVSNRVCGYGWASLGSSYSSLAKTLDKKPRHCTPLRIQNEPYDRKKEMQNFVAEAKQEAMDKRAKTVLYNPDLHKRPAQAKVGHESKTNRGLSMSLPLANQIPSLPLAPVPWEARPAKPLDGGDEYLKVPSGLAPAEQELLANAILNPAPGLELPKFEPRRSVFNDPINGETPDKSLNPIDQTGSVSWAQLRPLTTVERERTRACMAKAAEELTTEVPPSGILADPESFSIKKNGFEHSQKWFNHDGRGEETLRAQIPAIAGRYAALRKTAVANNNGGVLPKSFKIGLDDGIAANVLMGEVVANLCTFFAGDSKSIEQRRNFHKVKTVPEFATDRAGIVGDMKNETDSYFDDDASGFSGAPVRIARDPRFRPHEKEGVKLKLEEEWKNRHEMYGRRSCK